MVWDTSVACAACPASTGNHLINAMADWCEVHRVLACEEKGWCLDSGCWCPEFSDSDSRVNNTFGDVIYSKVIMDYFQNATHDTPLSAEELQCVAESLATLPPLTRNNSRDQIQDHVFSSLFEKGARDEMFENIKDALTDEIFNYNVAFVVEIMLATQESAEAHGDSTDISGWDLSVVDWSIDGRDKVTDLSPEYLTSILTGMFGHPLPAETAAIAAAEYNGIWTDASGYTGCAQYQQFGSNHWNCPDAITAANPTVETCGEPEQVIETVCIAAGTEYWSWASGLMGAWSMQWWQDQLAKYDPPLSGGAQAGMMAGFADAMGGMNDLWFWNAGDSIQSIANSWFSTNMNDQSAIANEILYQNQDQFGGLDWLLAAGGYWGATFAASNGGSQWGMYDMISGVRNDGEWDVFGQLGDGSYMNATQAWFGDWIYGQDSGWQNEEWLKEYMNGSDSYMSLFNATHNIVFWDTTVTTGDDGDGIIWSNTVEYPVNEDCLRDIINEDIIEYFTTVGKPLDTINQVSTVLV